MQYLDEWRYPDSSLTGLLNICKEIFGELPPVFAKSKPAPSHNIDSETTANRNGKCFYVFAHPVSICGSKNYILLK